MKVFISQPMKSLSDEEIKATRERLVNGLDGEVEIIDSFFESAPAQVTPLWYLGEAIKLLGTADIAIFAKGWENARGCRIEHTCAEEYGIKIIEEQA